MNDTLRDMASVFELDEHQVDALDSFVSLLQKHGERSNLVGTLDADRIAEEFVADSLRLVHLLNDPDTVGRLVDVGSGAGIPGVPLLVAMPACSGVLIEPRMKRSQFLAHALRSLSLADRVATVRDNWEPDMEIEAFRSNKATLWCSRAVFPPAVWFDRAMKTASNGDLVAVWTNGSLGDSPIERSPSASTTYDFGKDRQRTVALYSAN